MLPSIYRLPKKDFVQTMRRGFRSQIDGIQFISMDIDSSHSRLGILITKKFSKKAADRNRIKRQISMIFLPYLQKETKQKNIICKIVQPIQHISFHVIQAIVEKYTASAL